MSNPHQDTRETPERGFARELRLMFDRATQPGSAGIPWVDVIRAIVEAAERMADAKDRERAVSTPEPIDDDVVRDDAHIAELVKKYR